MAGATKKFGFWTLTFLVIANMVGAGVFTTSGFTLGDLKSPGIVVLAWIAGGVIALAGAASYGQLARAMPESGGEYLFLSRAVHPLLGFIAGWVSLIAGFSGAIAFAAMALESYLIPDRIRPAWLPVDVVAITSIVAAGIFHGIHARLGAFVQNGVVVLKLALLGIILVFAAARLGSHDWHPEGLDRSGLTNWELLSAFAGSLVWISLSYLGFNAAVYIADEAHEPVSNVPRALMVGTSLVVVLYVLLNAVFVYAAPPENIAGVPDVAAVAAEALGGVGFAGFVRFVICAGLLTSVFSMMMAAPRVYAKMAEDGFLPKFLIIRGEAPQAAMVAQVLIASALVLFSSLNDLLSYLGLTLSLSAACAVASLFSPRVRRKPFPQLADFPPLFYITSTLVTATLMTIAKPWQLVGTLVTVLTGVLVYVVVRRLGNNSVPAKRRENES